MTNIPERKMSKALAFAAIGLSMMAVAYTVAGFPGLEPATERLAER